MRSIEFRIGRRPKSVAIAESPLSAFSRTIADPYLKGIGILASYDPPSVKVVTFIFRGLYYQTGIAVILYDRIVIVQSFNKKLISGGLRIYPGVPVGAV